MPTVEERVDSLEAVLGKFIVNSDVSLKKLENEMMPSGRKYLQRIRY